MDKNIAQVLIFSLNDFLVKSEIVTYINLFRYLFLHITFQILFPSSMKLI